MKAGTVAVGFLDNGHWSACFGLSYRDLCLHDMASRRRIIREGGKELRSLCGSGGIPAGRNEVARQFLDATDAEWLWFIDTDMGFGPDTVDRLVAAADRYHRPVVGGLCFALKRRDRGPFYAERFGIIPTLYEYVETGDEIGFNSIKDYKRDAVMTVAGTGAACLLINRRALLNVREKSGDAWFDPITHPTGDHGKPRTFSEDLSFCVRLQSVDIPINVDTGVKTTHEKGGLFLDEEQFDRQKEGDARAS